MGGAPQQDDSLRTKIILGSPGCGKTTRLINEVEKALESGVPPEKIAYLAFTKKAASEAITRACAKFGYEEKRFKYFRTIHSLAFKDLGLARDEIMTARHLQEFGEQVGLIVKGNYNNYNSLMYTADGLGDKCYRIYCLAQAQQLPIKDVWEASEQFNLSLDAVENFCKALDKYKEESGVLDFTDFLNKSKIILPVDLFILDEAQDLTNQQWMYAKHVAQDAKRVLIAGDDDQAIFQWAGADLNYFLKIKADIEVLPISYRLPQEIYEFSNRIISPVKHRYDKKWKSTGKKGEINWVRDESHVDVREGEWMLLGREGYQLKRLVKLSRMQGAIYKFGGKWSNQEPYVRAIVQYERARKGKELSKKDKDLIAKFTNKGVENFKNDWMTHLNLIPPSDREYIRSVLRNKESLISEGRIKISTIHGSKGGEADNVLIITEASQRIATAASKNPDPERRVWYVGVSRSKANLFLVSKNSFLKKLI